MKLQAYNRGISSNGINLPSYLFPWLIKEAAEFEILKVYILEKILWAWEAHKEVFSLSWAFVSCFQQNEGLSQLWPKKISKICSWLRKNVNFITCAVYEIHCLTDPSKLFLF